MILKNYWKWLNAFTTIPIHGADNYRVYVNIQGLDGLYYSLGVSSISTTQLARAAANLNLHNLTPRFGTGQSTITENDYCLANDITNSINDISIALIDSVTNGVSRIFAIRGTNSTSSSITITQIGLVMPLRSTTDTPSPDYNALFSVVTLNNPITVGAGDSFSISVEWTEV